MIKKFLLTAVYLCLIAIFGSCSGTPHVNLGKNCTDEEIVKSIYDKMKADKDLSEQIRTVNVIAKDGRVIAIGWTRDEKSWDLFKTLVISNTDCPVSKPDLTELLKQRPPENHPRRPTPGGSCVPGTFRCGDVCIPDGQKCNI